MQLRRAPLFCLDLKHLNSHLHSHHFPVGLIWNPNQKCFDSYSHSSTGKISLEMRDRKVDCEQLALPLQGVVFGHTHQSRYFYSSDLAYFRLCAAPIALVAVF